MHSGLSAYERYPEASTRLIAKDYQRRKPEETVLSDVVSRNLNACLSAAQERSEHGYGYPRFVEREFKKYLDCGQLRHGFVRVKCADCPNEKLVFDSLSVVLNSHDRKCLRKRIKSTRRIAALPELHRIHAIMRLEKMVEDVEGHAKQVESRARDRQSACLQDHKAST